MQQDLKNRKFDPSEEGDYDYLLKMPLWSLCKDKMLELENQMTKRQ